MLMQTNNDTTSLRLMYDHHDLQCTASAPLSLEVKMSPSLAKLCSHIDIIKAGFAFASLKKEKPFVFTFSDSRDQPFTYPRGPDCRILDIGDAQCCMAANAPCRTS